MLNRLRSDSLGFKRSPTRFFELGSGGWRHFGASNHSFTLAGGWKLESFSEQQFSAGLTSLSGVVHVPGGGATQAAGSTVHKKLLNGVWVDAQPLLSARFYHAVAKSRGSMFILGGLALSNGPTLRLLDKYDPTTESWERLADHSHGAINFGLIGHRDHLLQVGGSDPATQLGYATTNQFNTQTLVWTAMNSMPTALSFHSYAGIGDEDSYTFLGATSAFAGSSVYQTRRFTRVLDSWSTSVPPRPPTYYSQSAAMEIGGRIVSYSGREGVNPPRPPHLSSFDGANWSSLPNIGADFQMSTAFPQQCCGL